MAATRAGYQVAALDIFNDVETRRCCFYSAAVPFANGGFVGDALLQVLNRPELQDATVVYGSGLENQPDVLARLEQRYLLLGNTAETVALLKQPQQFFTLLDRLAIVYPETRFSAPDNSHGWLAKMAGGSGGTHIHHEIGRAGAYFQRQVCGEPVSILFLADGRDMAVIGYNEQWLAPTAGMPFRFGGGVGNVTLPAWAQTAMGQAAQQLVRASGMRGLNSMDFMLDGEQLWALEVNPRLSASFDYYDVPQLFDWHMAASQGQLPTIAELPHTSKASLILYAAHDMRTEPMNWPAWAADIPPDGAAIRCGEPVCSVQAVADNAPLAKTLVFARARQVEAQLRQFQTTLSS